MSKNVWAGLCLGTATDCASVGLTDCNNQAGCSRANEACSGDTYSYDCAGGNEGSCNGPLCTSRYDCMGASLSCGIFGNQADCESGGCTWGDGSCSGSTSCSAAWTILGGACTDFAGCSETFIECSGSGSGNCSEIGDEGICGAVGSCSWTGDCVGTPDACSSILVQGTCGAEQSDPQYGCYWSNRGSCVGSATACAGVAVANCGNQAGCSTQYNSCSGTGVCSSYNDQQANCLAVGCSSSFICGSGYDCNNIAIEDCGNYPGCWDNNGSCDGGYQSCNIYNEANCAANSWMGCTTNTECSGSMNDCSTLNEATCGTSGCTQNFSCIGTATQCPGLNQGQCGATVGNPQYGCYWSPRRTVFIE